MFASLARLGRTCGQLPGHEALLLTLETHLTKCNPASTLPKIPYSDVSSGSSIAAFYAAYMTIPIVSIVIIGHNGMIQQFRTNITSNTAPLLVPPRAFHHEVNEDVDFCFAVLPFEADIPHCDADVEAVLSDASGDAGKLTLQPWQETTFLRSDCLNFMIFDVFLKSTDLLFDGDTLIVHKLDGQLCPLHVLSKPM